ncbi:MAG: tRNA 2-thiouridine(34) synthase MnmA [Firmicutes bacterium]|nr:tRNA 2-thiouridine(34) synthase MnmA [Bacillota bacterium]
MEKKAIIAMSGGVDSAVAALLTQKQGFDCIGITMRLFNNEDVGVVNQKSCCSLEDAALAEQAANRLNMPFYVLNMSKEFNERVIDNFVSEYQRGATPNPCVDCNRHIKFKSLFDKAAALGINYVVTGHYAIIERDLSTDRFLLKKGVDPAKDQSYFLYAMTQHQLKHTLFPLGNFTKEQTRKIAAENGFANAAKPDSQDICFVQNGDYSAFIEQYTNQPIQSGDFLDSQNNVIGKHNGQIKYTIGQRKGLGIAFGTPMYVVSKNPQNNTVTLGEESQLFTNILYAQDFNWIIKPPQNPIKVTAKVRYTQKEQPATAQIISHDKVKVEFSQPLRAIASGQAVVLYENNLVLGGGTII